MFHVVPRAPGKQPRHGVSVIGLAVARTTWKTSSALSGRPASTPAECTSAATPACSGTDCDVDPFSEATENSACDPYDVTDDRERNVVVSGSLGSDCPSRLVCSATTPLPGQTCAKRMPSVWSEDSKSFDAHAITTPLSCAYSTAARIDGLCPSDATTSAMTSAPESTANAIASATRSGRSIASSPALTDSSRQRGHMPAPPEPLSASPSSALDSALAWL